MQQSSAPTPVPAARVYFPPEDVEELGERIKDILRSGRLTLGPLTEEFERTFASAQGRRFAVAVNSGTSALEIIFRALRITDGEVIAPTNTFAATAFAVLHAGNRLVLADSNSDLFVDPEDVERRITPRTRAVVAVHIGGRVVPQVDELSRVCREHGLQLIEDAAHAHGSMLGSRHAGAFGIAASFSFYPTKVMTSGEGGMILTDDEDLAARCRVFRDQGKSGFAQNVHTELGYNWRLSEIHACIGVSQLKRLPAFLESRRAIASVYNDALADFPGIMCLQDRGGMRSNFYKYIVLLPNGVAREQFKDELRARYAISLSGEVYELPLHRQPVFEAQARVERGFPVAEDLCRRHICLPIFATMTAEQALYVSDSLRKVLS